MIRYLLILTITLSSSSYVIYGQISDACPGANTITPSSTCVTQNYDLAGSFINGGLTTSSCVSTNRDDGWYRFTASSSQTEITITANGQSVVAALYSGTNCSVANGSELDCVSIPDASSGTITFNTVSGNTYLIQIHRTSGNNTAGVTGTICVWNKPLPPINDDCTSAISVPVVSGGLGNCTGNFTLGNLGGATPSIDANLCGGIANNDIWFSFVATSNQVGVGIQEGGGLNSYHSIYEGICGSLTQVSCSDPNVSSTYNLTIGNTYYLRIYTSDASTPNPGFVNVCVAEIPPPPVNDECSSAVVLTPSTNGVCSPYNGVNSPTISVMLGCNPLAEDDVWFSFTATNTTHHLELSPKTSYSTEVFTGTCGTLNLISCNERWLNGLTIGETYYVRVYLSTSYGGGSNTFSICITTPPDCDPLQPPPNDFCSFATPITSFSAYCGTTLNSYTVDEFPTGFCNTATTENNSWLSFTASSTTVEIKYWISGGVSCTVGVQYALYSGSCGSLNEVPGSCINPTGHIGDYGLLTFNGLNVGETYYIMIDGFGGDVCDYVWQGFSGILLSSSNIYNFKSTVKNSSEIALSWLAENNNILMFDIEKHNGDKRWKSIQKIKPTNSHEAHYNITDFTPKEGYNYYRIKVIDMFNNVSTTNEIVAIIKESNFSIYLNSNNKELSIKTNQKEFIINIYSSLGESVLEVRNTKTLSLQNLQNGLYIIDISTIDGERLLKKIII
jgi:large repetitive protein